MAPTRVPESEAGTSEMLAVPPEPPTGGLPLVLWRLGGLLVTIRPHQWVKNVAVLLPMVFARELFVVDLIVRGVGAFGVFCLLAGAVYTMNDLVDLDADAVASDQALPAAALGARARSPGAGTPRSVWSLSAWRVRRSGRGSSWSPRSAISR